jgi:hypothetical protein
MKYFLEEEDDGDYGRKRELFKEACKEMDVKFSHDTYEFYLRRCDGSPEDMSCEKMKDYLNECIIPFMKKSKTPVATPAPAPEKPAEVSKNDGAETLKQVKEVTPAPKKETDSDKKSETAEKKRDAEKVRLFKQICEESGDNYSLALFDDYEDWSKANGVGLNRYKKMNKFLDSLSKTK